MTVTSAPPGIPSPARLEKWLSQAIADEPVELTDIKLIAGGRSNLTYRLAVRMLAQAHGGAMPAPAPGGAGLALVPWRRGARRRPVSRAPPPLGHVLPTAHDMSREFRVLSGLAGTKVPGGRAGSVL